MVLELECLVWEEEELLTIEGQKEGKYCLHDVNL